MDQKCSKSDLSAAFSPFGVISLIDYHNNGRASVKYSVPDAARLAIQRMNLVPLCGCCLNVSIFYHATQLEVRRITKQPHLTAIIQSRRLSIFGHIARMDDDADDKMILTAPAAEDWKRPPGRPCITWLNTVRDLRAYKFTLSESVDLMQNNPVWRLMSTYGAVHS